MMDYRIVLEQKFREILSKTCVNDVDKVVNELIAAIISVRPNEKDQAY